MRQRTNTQGNAFWISEHILFAEKVTMSSNITDLEQVWNTISMDILKLRNMVEGVNEHGLTTDDHTRIYSTLYGLGLGRRLTQGLYHKYRESIEEYITSTVLPKLKENHGESLLKEFVRRWEIHKKFVRILSNWFHIWNVTTFRARASLCLEKLDSCVSVIWSTRK